MLGIGLALTKKLLAAGCSVMVADLRLRPEAEEAYKAYPHPAAADKGVSVVFHKTDMREWAEIGAMFEACLAAFGQVDVVVNGAGVFEPPSSSFWRPPGSAQAGDPVDGNRCKQHPVSITFSSTNSSRSTPAALCFWRSGLKAPRNLLLKHLL